MNTDFSGHLLTTAELARALGVSVNTVHCWETYGEPRPPSVPIGARRRRYQLESVLAWLEAGGAINAARNRRPRRGTGPAD